MDTLDQIAAKADDFLAGRYGKLTTAEIEEFRDEYLDDLVESGELIMQLGPKGGEIYTLGE